MYHISHILKENVSHILKENVSHILKENAFLSSHAFKIYCDEKVMEKQHKICVSQDDPGRGSKMVLSKIKGRFVLL